MTVIGRLDSLWRYPVKSMRGEELAEAYVGFAGVYGDRLYAIRNAMAPAGFPSLTARELGSCSCAARASASLKGPHARPTRPKPRRWGRA